MKKCVIFLTVLFGVLFGGEGIKLDIVSFQDLVQKEERALEIVKRALLEKGIVGVRGIPNFLETREKFLLAAREFEALPEKTKSCLAPDRLAGDQLGYEGGGVEKFQREDGTWMIDDVKASYYAIVPFDENNKWPKEVDLKGPYLAMGAMMAKTGRLLMQAVSVIEEDTFTRHVGRMLHYKKSFDLTNPQWCGAHFDHGLFTGLIPPVYFQDGKKVEQPEEAGLYVRPSKNVPFEKVLVPREDVMLFQVGEFAQLMTNDAMVATEHFVHKPKEPMERYTMAMFFEPAGSVVVNSTSSLAKDTRYRAPFTYDEWSKNSFARYLVDPSEK